MDEVREIVFTVADGVGRIRLNRPEQGNAVDAPMADGLLAVALECARRDDVRAVLLEGAGAHFCVGGDIKAFGAAGTALGDTLTHIVTPLHAAAAVLARMRAPVVAAIQGTAAGGGLGLALMADIALAARSASFKSAYTAIGMCGDVGVTYMLPRLVGVRRARELMLTNRKLSAAEALELGIVERVCEDSSLLDEALSLARSLAQGAPLAHGTVKNLLLDSGNASLEQQLAAEARGMAALGRSADGQEAVAAFLGKRAARFVGR